TMAELTPSDPSTRSTGDPKVGRGVSSEMWLVTFSPPLAEPLVVCRLPSHECPFAEPCRPQLRLLRRDGAGFWLLLACEIRPQLIERRGCRPVSRAGAGPLRRAAECSRCAGELGRLSPRWPASRL